MRRRLTVMVVATPFLVIACGDPDAASEASPLEAIYGETLSPAEQRAKQLEQEEAVAQCMRDEGWEYTPVDYTAQFNDQAFEDPSEEGYGEKYGYGFVRNYEIYEWPYLDEDGNYSSDGGFGGDFEDPNQDYVMALTPEESEQYYAALSGDPSQYEPEIDPVTGEEVYPMPSLEEQGCYGKAQLEVYGDQPFNDQDFNDRFSALMEDMQNDPRLEDAEIAWSDCVYEADQLYDFFGPDDIYTYIDGLLNDAKGLKSMPADMETGQVIGGDGTEQVWMMTETADGEAIAYVGQPKKLTEAQMRELQEEEVALWKIDQDCQDETGYQDIRREIEQEVADTLTEEFPEFAASQNGAQG